MTTYVVAATYVVMVSTLQQRLRRARTLAELPARELDRLAGIRQGHSGIIEARASENVETATAQALARVLGVSLDWLIAGKGKEPTQRAVRAAVEIARSEYAAKETAANDDADPKKSNGTEG